MSTPESKRSLTATELAAMSGLEYLQSMIDGKHPFPPMSATLSFHLTEVGPGRATIAGEPRPEYYNPGGTIHGAWAAALLDSCMGSSIHTTLPPHTRFTTVEFKINMLRPISIETGTVYGYGRLVKPGQRIAFADGELKDGEGRLLATGTTTCLIFPPEDR